MTGRHVLTRETVVQADGLEIAPLLRATTEEKDRWTGTQRGAPPIRPGNHQASRVRLLAVRITTTVPSMRIRTTGDLIPFSRSAAIFHQAPVDADVALEEATPATPPLLPAQTIDTERKTHHDPRLRKGFLPQGRLGVIAGAADTTPRRDLRCQALPVRFTRIG